jgi:hypothetical protein
VESPCQKHQAQLRAVHRRAAAYVHLWIEELGPDAEMKDALKIAPCFFCKSKGDLIIQHMGD